MNNKERFTQEKVGYRDSSIAHGATPNATNYVIMITNWTNILLKLNCVEIQRQKSQTSMNLKLPCLISADWSCSCCSSVTLLSRRHELFWMAQILNTFVRLVCGEALGQFDTLSAEV